MAEEWTYVNLFSSGSLTYFTCDKIYLGGPELVNPLGYMTRTYSSLISHQTVFYFMALASIDNQTVNAQYSIKFDNMEPLVWIWNDIPNNYDVTTTGCGGSGTDYLIYTTGFIKHSSSTLTVKLSSTLPQGISNYFAISNFRVLLAKDQIIIPSGSCVNQYGQFIRNRATCLSQNSNYQTDSSQLTCNSPALYCYGSLVSQGYTCETPGSYDGTSCRKCLDPNCYLCADSPVKCYFCANSYYLYWDYTCQIGCQPPYLPSSSGLLRMCETPCQSSNAFMFSDHTCIASCDFPLSTRIEGQAKFCDYPCSTTSTDYLYWDGSCHTSCPHYQRTEGSVYNYCDACQPGYFSYPNTTCKSKCIAPYVQSPLGGSVFCISPCLEANGKYYDTDLQICKATCEYPYFVYDTIFCVLDLSNEEIQQVATIASLTSSAGNISSITASAASLVSSSNPASFLLQTVAKMLQYTKYINIKYPPKLTKMLRLQKTGTSAFLFIPPMNQSLKRKFPDYSLPENFSQYSLYSSFIVNFWASFLSLLIVMTIAILSYICKTCITKNKAAGAIFEKLSQTLKWNFSLMFFITFFDEIILYTSFDLLTSNLFTALPIVEWMLCLTINLFVLIIVAKSFFIIWNLQRVNVRTPNIQQSQSSINTEPKYLDYEVVFKSYKDSSFLQQAFLPISLVRIYVFHLIIAYAFKYPLIQSILIVLLNILMLLYLALIRSPKEKLKLVQYLIQEIILLVVNICVLVIAVIDATEFDAVSAKKLAGDSIIVCNTIFTISGTIFICLSLVVSMWYIVKEKWSKRQASRQVQALPSILEIQSGSVLVPKESIITPKDGNYEAKSIRREANLNEVRTNSKGVNPANQRYNRLDYSTNTLNIADKDRDMMNVSQLEFLSKNNKSHDSPILN